MHWIVLVFFSLLSGNLLAERPYLTFPSDIDWKTQRSEHFQVLYRSGQTDFAQRTLIAAEKAHRLLKPIFPETPPLTSIILADFSDSLNGYSLNFPYHHFVIYGVPPDSTSELSELDHWLDSVVLHEYAHTLHLYPAGGLWSFLRLIFGSVVVPNGMLPQHVHEGLATFLETEFSDGGRGKGPTFEMFTRKAVENNQWGVEQVSLDQLDGSFSKWPQGKSPYFYGFHFFSALWKLRGKSGISNLTIASSKNWPYFVNTPLQEVYEKTSPSLWNEIFQDESIRQKQIINKIRGSAVSPLQYLTESGFQKSRLALSSSRESAAFFSENPNSGKTLSLLNLKQGQVSKEVSLNFSESGGLCYHDKPNKDLFVFSSPFEIDGYLKNRLSAFHLQKKLFFPLKLAGSYIDHVREIDCHPDLTSYLIYRDTAGKGHLQILTGAIPGPDRNLTESFNWTLPEGTWISSVLFGSPHYFLLRQGMRTSLYLWNPPEPPTFLGSIQGHAFHLKRSVENSLSLISSISHRYEIWDWNLNDNQLTKLISVVGGVNSFLKTPDGFLVSSYEKNGFDIAKTTGLERDKAPTAFATKEEPLVATKPSSSIKEENYSPLSSLVPRAWIPSALFVPFGLQVGAWIPMFDLSQKHFYDINFGLDQRETNSGNQSLPMGSFIYGYRFGKSSQVDLNSYFSPGFLTLSKSFFKQWGSSLNYSWRFWESLFQIRFSALFRRIESSTLGPANQSAGLGASIGWSSRNSLNAFQPELNRSGVTASISHQQYIKEFGSDQSYFSTLINIESALTNPFWKQSLWTLTLRQGYTEGTPFYNNFFQGGGEILFTQGREFFLNRGYLQGSFIGRRMFGGNLEFRFPISQVERGIGLLPVFLNNISGALVVDTTSYDFGSLSQAPRIWMKEFLWSTGFEMNTRWRFFYYLPTTIRLGAYRGLSAGGESFYFTLGLEASL